MSTYSCWVDYITPKSLMCLIYNLRSSVWVAWTLRSEPMQSTSPLPVEHLTELLRASPRVLCLVSRRGRLSASHSSVTATAITNRITRYGNTKWLRTAVSGHARLILIGVQRATVQQNFLIQGLVTHRQSAGTCQRGQPLGPSHWVPSHQPGGKVQLNWAVLKTLCV